MPNPLIGIGTTANDGTGDPLRTAFQKINRLPNPDNTINAGSGDYLGTTEAKITAAIAAAAAGGYRYVFVPQSMLPYNATLVVFNNAVRMVREGGNPAVFDVRAYGAYADATTNDSPAFQAAVNACVGSLGGIVYMPEGIYSLTQTINIYPNITVIAGTVQLRGAGPATILRPTILPTFMIGGLLGTTLSGFAAADFQFQLTSFTAGYYADGLIHLRLTVQWHFARIGMVSGTNRLTDLYQYPGYLFNFDSSYLGVVEKCWVEGRGVYMFELNDFIDPNQQTDTVTFIDCHSTGMALGMIHAPTGATDDHNFTLYTPKHVMVTGWAEANVSTETTLTSSPAAGASSFTIASATGIAQGDFLWIGIGTSLELVYVGTLAGTTVTLTANQVLRFAHTSGDLVFKGGFMLSTAPKCHNVWVDHPHCEFSAICVYNGGGDNSRVTDLYGTTKEIIRLAGPGGATTTYNTVVERGQWHWPGAGTQCAIRVLTQGDGSSNTYFLYGPFVDPNTGNPPATIYLNDAGTTREVRQFNILSGGVPVLLSATSGSQAIGTLLENYFAGGSTIHERDLAGGLYSYRLVNKSAAPTDGATVTPDCSQGNYQRCVLGGSRTLAAPTNAPASGRAMLLTLELFNNTVGAITTTFNAIYVLAGAWTDAAASKSRQITFGWNWSRNKWIEVSRTTADT